jgi:hypothetical protein
MPCGLHKLLWCAAACLHAIITSRMDPSMAAFKAHYNARDQMGMLKCGCGRASAQVIVALVGNAALFADSLSIELTAWMQHVPSWMLAL